MLRPIVEFEDSHYSNLL